MKDEIIEKCGTSLAFIQCRNTGTEAKIATGFPFQSHTELATFIFSVQFCYDHCAANTRTVEGYYWDNGDITALPY